MRRQRCLVVLLVAVAAALVTAGTAAARTIVVHPGDSIQAAVDQAKQGDTILVEAGTYAESVAVTKHRLKIVGRGAELVPGEPNPRCFEAPVGFCVLGKMDENGRVTKRVRDVSIGGFTIRDFADSGILAVGARSASFRFNKTVHNEEYGIAAFDSTGTRIVNNETANGGEAGIYVGDSPEANVEILNNDTYDSLFGVFVRNAMHGTIAGNSSHGNCVGVVILADAPGPAGFFDIGDNEFVGNDKACPADEGPPLSGIGVFLWGATGNTVHDNQVLDNTPTGPTAYTGGVVVAEGFAGTAPTNNLVTNNVVLGNSPDIFWDETGTGNQFVDNECDTSQPPGLCT
jgi:nitrous oxidase accessory protein NosD